MLKIVVPNDFNTITHLIWVRARLIWNNTNIITDIKETIGSFCP